MRALVLLVVAACAAPAPPRPRAAVDPVASLELMLPADAFKDFDWSPADARAPAEQMFTNVRVLTGVDATRFMTAMLSMQPSIGAACAHCHDEPAYPSDEKDPKLMGRRMLLLAADVNHRYFGDESRVTCWGCHRGELRPPSAPEGFGATLAAQPARPVFDLPPEQAQRRGRAVWKNLAILGGRQAGGLKNVMNAFNVVLGVSCTHCHVENDWASDAVPAKARTRAMLRLTGHANAVLGSRGAVSCWTCHRGDIRVARSPHP